MELVSFRWSVAALSKKWARNMDLRWKYPIAIFTLLSLSAMAWGQEAGAKRMATPAEQKMCSEQARNVDAEWERRAEYATQPTYTSNTSHYDPVSQICYVMITDIYAMQDGSYMTRISVTDAFGGREYGLFRKEPSGTISNCSLSPLDNPSDARDHSCDSEPDFRDEAFKLYGIAQR